LYAEGENMKARNYREVKGVPYTRKEFIHGVPQPKITKFTMGDPSVSYGYRLSLISLERAHIRHNALEAARVAANRYLQDKVGEKNYYLRVSLYPHVVLRENKMIFGAHADRLSDGMKRAFGKPIGTAARVELNQPVIIVNVNEDTIDVAKEALRRGASKLPTKSRIVIEKIVD